MMKRSGATVDLTVAPDFFLHFVLTSNYFAYLCGYL